MSRPTLLQVENLTVSFDGFQAIKNLSLSLDAGSLRVLIGPNGAGKSTLCDTIIGRVHPLDGHVVFRDVEITRWPEHRIVQMGICRKFQTPGILSTLSVYDNLAIAARRDRSWWHSFGSSPSAQEDVRIQEIMDTIGLRHRQQTCAGDLAHGEKQWLEIGMVVATDAELLLLDEPTAGMGAAETTKTAGIIRSLVGRHTVLVIDHDMSFVEQLDAPISVLHMGSILKHGSISEIRRDPEVTAVYLGRCDESAAAA